MSSFFLLAVLSMPAHYPHPRAVPYVGPVNFVGKYAPRWIDYWAYSYGPSGGVLAAGLLNALEIQGKSLSEAKIEPIKKALGEDFEKLKPHFSQKKKLAVRPKRNPTREDKELK
ncbi:MAG: hypothetical protein EBV06_07725, partial [Planctomycetia bacterium]|nr:hypothetical protein [Planctomycetia bacterium]